MCYTNKIDNNNWWWKDLNLEKPPKYSEKVFDSLAWWLFNKQKQNVTLVKSRPTDTTCKLQLYSVNKFNVLH